MYIDTIHVYGFGNMVDCVIEAAPGVIKTPGSASSSEDDLVFTFVRCMLYGMGGRGDTDMRARLRPLSQNGHYVKYGGEIVYAALGKRFRLTRLFGNTAGDDVIELIDLDNGRDVKIEAGRTPGEKTLKLTEGAFVTAAVLRMPPPGGFSYDSQKGGYVLGKLSCMGTLNDGKPSPYELSAYLNRRLLSITDPSTQSGELDKAVMRKMSTRNEISRIGDIDNKITAKTAELRTVAGERDTIRASLNQDRRTGLLSKAARALLAKDRIMAEYERLTQLLKELDVQRSENKALAQQKITGALVPSIIVLAAGILLLGAGIFGISNAIGIAALAAGIALVVAGGVMLPLSVAKYRDRFYVKRDGVKVLLSDETARLKQEISARNAEIVRLLGDKTADEADDEWRSAETLMRNATDDERRFAVLKMTEEREDSSGDDERLSAVNARIAALQAEIDELCKSFGRSFSTASLVLEGIDEDIKRLNDEAEAVRLSILAAETAAEKLRHDIIPEIIRGAKSRYKDAFGGEAVIKCGGTFEIVAAADDPYGAYFAFLTASSDVIFGDTRNSLFAELTGNGTTCGEALETLKKLDGERTVFVQA
ncbi:MAG: hypothetical protein IKX06_01055 [Clostridia bacterium]|nr:hypothetical protein [Clostridia bacterium]